MLYPLSVIVSLLMGGFALAVNMRVIGLSLPFIFSYLHVVLFSSCALVIILVSPEYQIEFLFLISGYLIRIMVISVRYHYMSEHRYRLLSKQRLPEAFLKTDYLIHAWKTLSA